MPKGIYNNLTCDIKHNKIFTPTKHQKLVIEKFPISPYKGMLLFHKLGSGKTCTSILVAEKMIKEKKIKKVFVITPGSLRKNWLEEYCEKCGLSNISLKNYFTFITYNYNVYNQLSNIDFNNSLIIIDEVHNMINSVKNISKNCTYIYNKIINSNCRVLALSGTPIVNDTYEWSILGNMLKPHVFKNIIYKNNINKERWDEKLLNDDMFKGIISYYPGEPNMYPRVIYHEPIKCVMTPIHSLHAFIVYTTEDKIRAQGPPNIQLKYTNPVKYATAMAFYIVASKFILSRRSSNFFYPLFLFLDKDISVERKKIENSLINTNINDTTNIKKFFKKSTSLYIKNTIEENKDLIDNISKNDIDIDNELNNILNDENIQIAINNVKETLPFYLKERDKNVPLPNIKECALERQKHCKANFPLEYHKKMELIFRDMEKRDNPSTEDEEYDNYLKKCHPELDNINKKNDDEDDDYDDIYNYLPDKLESEGGWINHEKLKDKFLLFCSTKIATLLCNIILHKNVKHMVYTYFKKRSGVYLIHSLLKKCGIPSVIYSGDLSDKERTNVLKKFNDIKNRNGKYITVILITDAGSEGINLLEINHVHILESSTKERKILQAIGRAVRYKSHIDMPINRQYVEVWRYFSININSGFKNCDEYLYKLGNESINKTDIFIENRLIKNSIENNSE
jgi:superfamily II DNA or RNA helicase